VTEWRTAKPDGREILARYEGDLWIVRSGTGEARSRSLDVALIEIARTESDVDAHASITNYATWIREQAAKIEEKKRLREKS